MLLASGEIEIKKSLRAASERARKEKAPKKRRQILFSSMPPSAAANSTLRSSFLLQRRPLNNSHSHSIKYQDVWQMYKKSEVRSWLCFEWRMRQREEGGWGRRREETKRA